MNSLHQSRQWVRFENEASTNARFHWRKKRAKSRDSLRFLASRRALARNDIQLTHYPSRPFLDPFPRRPLYLILAPWRTYASERASAGLRGIR